MAGVVQTRTGEIVIYEPTKAKALQQRLLRKEGCMASKANVLFFYLFYESSCCLRLRVANIARLRVPRAP